MAPAPTEELVMAALATVDDPEIHRPITELDMVRSVSVGADGAVAVEVLLTVSGCPMRDEITRRVTGAVSQVPGVSAVSVELGVMTEEQRHTMTTLDAAAERGRPRPGRGPQRFGQRRRHHSTPPATQQALATTVVAKLRRFHTGEAAVMAATPRSIGKYAGNVARHCPTLVATPLPPRKPFQTG